MTDPSTQSGLESEWGTALVCPECGTPERRDKPNACEGCGSFEDPVELDVALEVPHD